MKDFKRGKTNWGLYFFFAGAVDGVFTTWTAWTTCTEPTLCLQGFKTRTRTCTNPPPANGGDDCLGLSQENKDCPTEADGCSGKESIGIFGTQIFCQSCPEMYMYILQISVLLSGNRSLEWHSSYITWKHFSKPNKWNIFYCQNNALCSILYHCYSFRFKYVFRLEENNISRVMGQNSLTSWGNSNLNFGLTRDQVYPIISWEM